ncbi:MAG: T9SS type A sorting domain-containing protein, partial [Bacteroidota bacterium]
VEDFTSLKVIKGTFRYKDETFSNFQRLEHLEAYPSLEELGGISIYKFTLVNSLKEIKMLDKLTGEGDISFVSMNIKNLEGLPSHIIALKGDLILVDLPLESLSGLPPIRKIGRDCRLGRLSLFQLDELQFLEEVGRDFEVSYLPLSDLKDLAKLRKVGSTIRIDSLSELKSLEGLGSITSLGENLVSNYAIIDLRNNPQLESCCEIQSLFQALPEHLRQEEKVYLSGNGLACNDFQQPSNDCSTLAIQSVAIIPEEDPSQSFILGQDVNVFQDLVFKNSPVNIQVYLNQRFSPQEGRLILNLRGPINHYQVERVFPYELFGDGEGKVLPPGFYRLEVKIERAGIIELVKQFSFWVSSIEAEITGFRLINPETDEVIRSLVNGSVINLAELPNRQFNIQALTFPEMIGSVELVLSGSRRVNQVESIAPYALFGNDRFDLDDYLGQTLAPGKYRLGATPFTGAKKQGVPGVSVSIDLEVISQQSLEVYPNPSPGNIQIHTTEVGTIQIYNQRGELIYQKEVENSESGDQQVSLPQAGLYLLRMLQGDQVKEQKILVK